MQTQFPAVLEQGTGLPSSPDLNPMDFSVWYMLETETCRSSHTKHVESLKASLVKGCAKIPQKKLRAAVESFRGRIERVIKGSHIEKYIMLLFWNKIWNMQHSFPFISLKIMAVYFFREHCPHPIYLLKVFLSIRIVYFLTVYFRFNTISNSR